MTILSFLQKKTRADKQNHYRTLLHGLIADYDTGLYVEEYFNQLLRLEIKRTERSRTPFLLMLIDIGGCGGQTDRQVVAERIANVLIAATRETDTKGWYSFRRTVGAIFTEIIGHGSNPKDAHRQISEKLCNSLKESLGETVFDKLVISWHMFPGSFDKGDNDKDPDMAIYPKVVSRNSKKKFSLFVKRVLDIVGSVFALVFFSPLFLGIAIMIKFDSKGPVLFKQQRVGSSGKKFLFLKFRSMHTDNDPEIHKEFVKKLIEAGKDSGYTKKAAMPGEDVFKIKADPRVTNVGRFLRKSSLDELPQFINVLKGDMSLVGPRPPIPYECEEYDIWHRRRVLEMKPGITGLWQVHGRSSTTFDEMVRMDIKYIREWSLWLDIKILLQTPLVVLTCKGAY